MEKSRVLEAVSPEILDRDDLPIESRRAALRGLARVNRYLFGRRALCSTLLPRLARQGRARQTALDVAAGAGDGHPALRRQAGRRGVDLSIVAVDRQLSHLAIGRSLGDVDLAVVADGAHLPFVDRAFDWSISSLFFHHLDDLDKRRVRAQMRSVARVGAVVVDLRRSLWAAAALVVFGLCLGIGRIALLDGLVSLRRSWSMSQWRSFSGDSGEVPERRFPARVVAVFPSGSRLPTVAREAPAVLSTGALGSVRQTAPVAVPRRG